MPRGGERARFDGRFRADVRTVRVRAGGRGIVLGVVVVGVVEWVKGVVEWVKGCSKGVICTG